MYIVFYANILLLYFTSCIRSVVNLELHIVSLVLSNWYGKVMSGRTCTTAVCMHGSPSVAHASILREGFIPDNT